MIPLKMTTEEFNMMIVALQNTANGCEQTARVHEQSPGSEWRGAESRKMAQKYDSMAVDFRNQINQGGK